MQPGSSRGLARSDAPQHSQGRQGLQRLQQPARHCDGHARPYATMREQRLSETDRGQRATGQDQHCSSGQQLFACFADFRQAYKTAPREQLWVKLHSTKTKNAFNFFSGLDTPARLGSVWRRAVQALLAQLQCSDGTLTSPASRCRCTPPWIAALTCPSLWRLDKRQWVAMPAPPAASVAAPPPIRAGVCPMQEAQAQLPTPAAHSTAVCGHPHR